MAENNSRAVSAYIAAQPDAARIPLKHVRDAIRKALPEAEETVAYKMPAYKSCGEIVLYFAGWKHHYAIYPANERLIAAFKDHLATYHIGKGTIRFPLDEPVPARLIRQIAKFLAKDAVRPGRSGSRVLRKR